MDNREYKTSGGTVYLDKISITSIFRLLQVNGINTIIVLEKISKIQRFFIFLLSIKRVKVKEAIFFAGSLMTNEGNTVHRPSLRLASDIAMKAARQIVEAEPKLHYLNENFGRNTVRLFIAKQLHLHVYYWTLRVLVVKALSTELRAVVWLKKPSLFDHTLLHEAISDVDLYFYSTTEFKTIKLIAALFFDVARHMKHAFDNNGRNNCFTPSKTIKPSVLLFQENTNIRADRRLRAQPHHWLSGDEPPNAFNTYLVETRSFKISATDMDKFQLSKEGVTVLPRSIIYSACKAMQKNKTIQQVRRNRHNLIRAVFKATGFANKFFLLHVAFLLKQSEIMGALALWLNSKVFLNREPQFIYADAIQMVAEKLNITTIAYQYSNMGGLSPIMMSTADKFLVFSNMYKVVFQTDDISPHEFISTGYLYDGMARLLKKKAQEHRKLLNRSGAKFIVCYFDESIQDNRWGLVSRKEHLREIHFLVKRVLTDPTIGVVVKSQYMRNSPSQLYPNDKIIKKAQATGRYLELMRGVHRNEIYPTEAALTSDICIGHKFGATAALEAAIAGIRTVLLDPYGTNTFWDPIYAQADIEYKSMDSLLKAISGMRNNYKANQKLGDWSPILHHFDAYQDGKAASRLFDIINNCIIKTIVKPN